MWEPQCARTCFSSAPPPITLVSVLLRLAGGATAFLGAAVLRLDSTMSPRGPACGLQQTCERLYFSWMENSGDGHS